MKYVIFDDHTIGFFPMTHLRVTGDLRCGILKLRQRIEYLLEIENTHYIMEESLASLYQKRHSDWIINQLDDEEYIFINSRSIINMENKFEIESLAEDTALYSGDSIVAFRMKSNKGSYTQKDILEKAKTLQVVKTEQIKLWSYLWELMHQNGEWIRFDYENIFYDEENYIESEPGVTLLNPYDIWIGEGSVLKPGVVIDASEGPVIIDENVTIMANSVIMGPVYIGKNTIIKALAKIYPNTSIGPRCKIGGEVEDTIIQGYSNKQHDGFLGHSFIGEWVNIGADSNNSDLKNTYKSVGVYFYPEEKKIDTGSTFVGTFIGDHSKIGINCSINTGTMIGMGVNIYGSTLIDGFIPDFSWGQADQLQDYRLENFLETALIVKSRRNIEMSQEEINLIKEIYRRGKIA